MALKEILAKFGFEVDSRNLKKAEQDTDSFAKKVVKAFAAAEIVGGIKNFVLGMMDLEGRISDTSAALGISRSAFQEWSYVASRGGASAEDMATAFKILQKNAADGSKAFKDLGVDVKGAGGQTKETGALMGEVAAALAAVEDPAQRTKLALEVLGKGGSKLNAIFKEGPEAIEELRKRFVELGGGLSEEALDAIGGAADALDDVELASTSLKGNLMLVLAPGLRFITNLFATVIAYFNRGDASATRMKSALVTLGVVGAAAGWSMLKPYLPFLAAIAGIYLVVQDLFTFIQGGDSATGRVIEWLFGKGSAEKVRQDLIKLKADFKEASEYHASGYTFSDWMNDELERARRAIKRWPEEIAASLGTDVSGLWAKLGDGAAIGFADALLGGLPSLTKMVVQNVATMVSQAADALSELYDAGAKAAKDLIDGLVNGILAGVASVKQAVVTMATGGVTQPLDDKFKRKSPSRWMFDLGGDLDRGLAKGILAFAKDVDVASMHVAGVASAPITHQASYANRTVNAPVHAQNSIVIHGATDPRAVARTVGSTMTKWGFDEANRLRSALDL